MILSLQMVLQVVVYCKKLNRVYTPRTKEFVPNPDTTDDPNVYLSY